MQPREAPPSSKLSQDPPSGARRRGTGRGCCAYPHVHLTPSGAWVYPSQHPDCCLPLTEGQQVQQVTEHDLDFAPGPELDQIPKSRRLFCLSIIPAQTGLESSSQADRAPATRDKSKFHPCAVPDAREPQCHLQPRGRRDRGGFSSSLWLEKVVAGPNPAQADGTVNPSQDTEAQPRWPKEMEKYHRGSCKFPWRKRRSAIEILLGSSRRDLVHQLCAPSPCPAAAAPRAHLAPFTHLSRQISRFHSLLLANGNVVNIPGIIRAAENDHPRSPMSCQGGAVTHPRGSLLPQWSKQSKSDGRNKEMRLISLKG